jgi:hypothetical protein
MERSDACDVLEKFGGLDGLVIKEIPEPERRGGRSCLAGWLGGLDPIARFQPAAANAERRLSDFFGSFVFGTRGFPLSDVPLQ